MSFLTNYHGDRAPDRRPPSRVYACVNSIEPLGQTEHEASGGIHPKDTHGRRSTFDRVMDFLCPPGERGRQRDKHRAPDELLLLGSVDADWFDNSDGSLLEQRDADWNISILETTRTDIEPFISRDALGEGTWLEIELERTEGGPPVAHYLNLYGPPDSQSISRVRTLSDLDELHRRTSMDNVRDATDWELDAVLPIFDTEAAAVYDVGQGNCNALLDGGVPRLYFDFGGGVIGNRGSFPNALESFCLSLEPTIVLSHWDWDHWSSANRQPESYERTWIVPRQRKGLGPVHATFLGRLLERGRVLVWPQALPALARGDYTIVQCTGPRSSANDSGLALRLEHDTGGEKLRMLFPADAGYDHIPSSCDHELTALVAAHHGANTRSRQVPEPAETNTLVYSYGAENSYPHPSVAGREAHAAWQHVLETAHRDARGLGHVHLYWNTNSANAEPPCGGSACQLTCHQR
jgi:hypothetical protein